MDERGSICNKKNKNGLIPTGYLSNFLWFGSEQSGVSCQNYLTGNRQSVECYGLVSVIRNCDIWETIIGWNDSHIIK